MRAPAELRGIVADWRARGRRIAAVAASDALHDGQSALIATARAAADRTVVALLPWHGSIGAAAVPAGDEAADLARVAASGAEVAYLPAAEALYPPGFETRLELGRLAEDLCGAELPGMFERVTMLLVKVIAATGAEVTAIGEKDWQLARILARATADLGLATEVVICPTVRAADGLALSRRNAQLSGEARARAPALHATLREAASRIAGGAPTELAAAEAQDLLLDAGFRRIDYLECRMADTLRSAVAPGQGARVFGAARIDGQRLIDNVAVPRRDAAPG